ncbi:MAG: hypothetical protein Q8N16_02930 [bacterium]|nr:hypothetical protein [bacterium]
MTQIEFLKNRFLAVMATLFVIASFVSAMKSENYIIQDDSVNVGGVDQKSTNYLSSDTIGEVGTGEMASSSYKLKAGYQELQEVYISLTVPASNLSLSDMSLSTVVPVTNASGGAAWNIKTDNPGGYTLTLKTDKTSTLCTAGDVECFTDYSEVTSGTPETWNVNESQYQFGFSAFGNDVSTATWGTGSSCTSPSANNLKYRGFTSTTVIQIASSNARTDPSSGTDTSFCVAAEQKNVYAPNGSYTADITGTATTQ